MSWPAGCISRRCRASLFGKLLRSPRNFVVLLLFYLHKIEWGTQRKGWVKVRSGAEPSVLDGPGRTGDHGSVNRFG